MTLFKQADLKPNALARLQELCLERTYRAGEILVSANTYSDTLYLILEGAVDAFTQDEQVASLTAGDAYGEKQLLEPGPVPHTLKAATPTRTLELDGPAYDQFAKEYTESAFALQAVLARRVLQELKKAQSNLRLLFETFKAS